MESLRRRESLAIAKSARVPTDRVAIIGIARAYLIRPDGSRLFADPGPRRFHNHFVDAGLHAFLSVVMGRLYGGTSLWSGGWHVAAGSDTTTATAHGTTALTSAYATASSVNNGGNVANPSSGTWQTALASNWATGDIVGTVGEFGLFWRPASVTTAGGLDVANASLALIARVSVGDGSFSTLSPGASDQLAIGWTIKMTFA